MNRPEFRAFHAKQGWCDAKELRKLGLSLTFDGSVLYENHVGESNWQLSQYTGFKDVKNRKVFEDHIVIYTYPSEPYSSEPFPFIGKVEYVPELASFRVVTDDGKEEPIFSDVRLEIVGNLFEHSDMLEVE